LTMKKKLVTALSTALCGMSAIGAIGAGTAVIGTPNVMAAETTSVMINSKTFPDTAFRKYVRDCFDKDENGVLSDKEIKKATEVDLVGPYYVALGKQRPENLKGIEYLYNLNRLICFNVRQFKSADLSKAKNLTYVYVEMDNAYTSESPTPRYTYNDVENPKKYYFNAVYWAKDKGIITETLIPKEIIEEVGCEVNAYSFYPDKQCTREQVATMLWRLAGAPNPKSTKSVFSDVTNKKSESYKAILWANEKGIITGTNGKFTPTGICTREQVVTMLWRYAGKPNPKSMKSKFSDVTNKNSYSYKAIMWASENGITTGTNGKFSPTGKCKRCETVTFIYRYAQKFNK